MNAQQHERAIEASTRLTRRLIEARSTASVDVPGILSSAADCLETVAINMNVKIVAKSAVIADPRKKMIVSILRDKVSIGLSEWVEQQFAHGADVEEVEKSLAIALRQFERAKAYAARSADMAEA